MFVGRLKSKVLSEPHRPI